MAKTERMVEGGSRGLGQREPGSRGFAEKSASRTLGEIGKVDGLGPRVHFIFLWGFWDFGLHGIFD